MNIDERRAQIYQQREFEKKWADILNPLTEDELVALNKMVVHRIKILNQLYALGSLNRLKIGDQVKWNGSDRIIRSGKIIRLNSKTASISIGDNEGYWRVSPQLLEKID